MKSNKTTLEIKSNKRIFSNLLGEHSSVFSGNGMEFKELRQYNSGDDIRHINWKVTARTNTPTINIYNEDKQLNVVVVYLNSGSSYFGTQISKKDIMQQIFSIVSNSVVAKKDTLTSVIFNTKEEKFYKPTKHKAIVNIVMDYITNSKSLGNSVDYKNLSEYLLSKIKQKSLVFIIGDFLQMPDFRYIGAKHEVYCIIVRDRFEEDLKLLGEFDLIDTNNGNSENIFLDSGTVKKYNQQMKQHDAQLFTHFKYSNIRYKKIYTTDDVMIKLQQLTRG